MACARLAALRSVLLRSIGASPRKIIWPGGLVVVTEGDARAPPLGHCPAETLLSIRMWLAGTNAFPLSSLPSHL